MLKLFQAVDMTEGRPAAKIAAFTIPMIIGNVAQQLYSTVDSVIVGRFVGDNALAAVGSASPVLNLLYVLFIGISTGAGILVAQYFGAKERERLSKAICCCITTTLAAVIIIMCVSPLVIRPLLVLMKTPDSIINWCQSYLMITFMGIIGSAYYNILGGILRGLGDSVSALVYLLVATVINIVLDYTFVAKFGMGVAGVALATVIAQCISAALSLRKLYTMKDVFDMKKRYFWPEAQYTKRLISLGLPSGVTQAIFSMSMLIVQSLTNSFGEMFIAANVIVMRIDGFVMMPAFSFGNAMTTYTGQNVGAARMDRVKQGAKEGTFLAMCVSAVLTALILLFGKYIMAIFTTTQELIELSYHLMSIIAFGYILMEITQCLQGVMRGAGDTMTPMWISIFSSVLFRIPITYGLVYMSRTAENPVGNCDLMYVSMLICWTLSCLMTAFMYLRGGWKKKAVLQ